MTSEEIKQSLTMKEVVGQYGIEVNRNGFCRCPFHKEKTPSMKIYKDSFNCFGCGANGDVFKFVMLMDDVDFKTAFKYLGGTYADKSDYQRKLFQYRCEKRKETEKIREAKRKTLHAEVLEDIKMQELYKKVFPIFSDEWCDAVNRLEYDFYLLEYLMTEKR